MSALGSLVGPCLRALRSFCQPVGAAWSGTDDPRLVAPRRLWVDVSLFVVSDSGTGIQRVVRNLLTELLARPPAGYRVVTVASLDGAPYVEVPVSTRLSSGAAASIHRSGCPVVRPARGDAFLGLDLAPRAVTRRCLQLMQWRRRGVRLYFVLYDLLPELNPEWFSPGGSRWFGRWLRTLFVVADGVVCISKTTRREFETWCSRLVGIQGAGPKSAVIPLSAGINSHPQGEPSAAWPLPGDIQAAGFVLMVGTIEPRKGHGQALDAFEQLWSEGERCGLVIVGRKGWKVDDLERRLREHPEAGRRLVWLEGPADSALSWLYRESRGLLVASKGEGFGLPVVEAMYSGTPVLARDIPILREVGQGSGVSFFPNGSVEVMATALRAWLPRIAGRARGATAPAAGPSWADSCRELKRAMGLPE